MAAKLGGDDEEAIVDINITPFVDIILVVLIIFMVTATYITENQSKSICQMQLLVKEPRAHHLAINMDASEQLFFKWKPYHRNGISELKFSKPNN